MEPITAQEIVDILEARYAELQKQLDYAQLKRLDDPTLSIGTVQLKVRMRELETVLGRIDVGKGIERFSG